MNSIGVLPPVNEQFDMENKHEEPKEQYLQMLGVPYQSYLLEDSLR
jgi:hypothetical protein